MAAAVCIIRNMVLQPLLLLQVIGYILKIQEMVGIIVMFIYGVVLILLIQDGLVCLHHILVV